MDEIIEIGKGKIKRVIIIKDEQKEELKNNDMILKIIELNDKLIQENRKLSSIISEYKQIK